MIPEKDLYDGEVLNCNSLLFTILKTVFIQCEITIVHAGLTDLPSLPAKTT